MPVVIVLDALDESGTAGRNSLLMLIVNEFAMLPPWVKLIVTSRPESYITRATRALERLEQIVLDRDDPYNLQDIAVYIDSSLKEADGVNLTLAGRANMAQMIQRKSEGIFGYVAALVDMVHSGGLRQIRVGALPQGQSALYSDYLDRQFGKGRLSESARALVVDRMLPAIASARVPMKVSDLKLVLSAAGAPAKVVDEAVASAGSLFPIDGDGCMRCFHRSVLDFLRGTGAEEEGNEGNPWRVDMAAAHRIQAAVWGKQVLSLGPGAVDKRPSELIGVYGTTFAITHALLAAVESKAAPSTLPRVSLSARPKVVQIGQVPTGWDLVEVLICNLNLLVAMTEIPGVGALGYLMDVVTASDAMSAAGCDVKNVMAARRTSYSFPTTAIQVGPLDVCLLCPPDSWMYKAAVKAVAAGAQPRLRAAKPMRMFPGAMVRVNGGAFGCRGHVAVSQGSAVCVWSTSTLELCAVNTRHTDSVSCLAFSPDGKLIASGSDDKTIRVWLMDAIDTFEVVLVGHTAVPRHVVFSPDNQLLASASEDSTVS